MHKQYYFISLVDLYLRAVLSKKKKKKERNNTINKQLKSYCRNCKLCIFRERMNLLNQERKPLRTMVYDEVMKAEPCLSSKAEQQAWSE